MRLPKLKVIPGEVRTVTSCDQGSHCRECVLYQTRCDGCTQNHRDGFDRVAEFENFASCYQECNTCTGYEVRVPAICCRSPLSTTYLTAVTKGNITEPSFHFKERPKIDLKSKSVLLISNGGVNTIADNEHPLVPEDTECVAVNLTRVWGSNGFYSRDLKDYLHLPAKTKLLLLTITRDDLLERAWKEEFYDDPLAYQKVGLDYWMSLSFSSYLEQAHMHQYYQSMRTHFCIERSEAWFATGDHYMPGTKTDDIVLEAVSRIPQMIITPHGGYDMKASAVTQMQTAAPCGTHLTAILRYHRLVPSNVSFWFVGPGACSPSYMATVRKMCGGRDLYWVTPRTFYLAVHGHAMNTAGKPSTSKLSKLELVAANMEMHQQLVRTYG